jgi:hypothetical protein
VNDLNDELPDRTGPIGRIARLGWAAVFALTLASIVGSSGSARFRNPHILTEASAWFLHLTMLLIFVLTVGAVAAGLLGDRIARRVQAGSILAVAAAVGVAGAFGYAWSGSAWGFPLADLVWYFDVFVLAVNCSAFILAIVLGTPGCEIGVWRELIARARSETAGPTQGLACIVGIHLIDQWEARRRPGARPENLAQR